MALARTMLTAGDALALPDWKFAGGVDCTPLSELVAWADNLDTQTKSWKDDEAAALGTHSPVATEQEHY
jgi:hypothetical protein